MLSHASLTTKNHQLASKRVDTETAMESNTDSATSLFITPYPTYYKAH